MAKTRVLNAGQLPRCVDDEGHPAGARLDVLRGRLYNVQF